MGWRSVSQGSGGAISAAGIPSYSISRGLETVRDPTEVFKGDFEEKLAVRFYRRTPLTSKYLVVAYKELGPQDGFVVTAYFARRLATWRERLWKR